MLVHSSNCFGLKQYVKISYSLLFKDITQKDFRKFLIPNRLSHLLEYKVLYKCIAIPLSPLDYRISTFALTGFPTYCYRWYLTIHIVSFLTPYSPISAYFVFGFYNPITLPFVTWFITRFSNLLVYCNVNVPYGIYIGFYSYFLISPSYSPNQSCNLYVNQLSLHIYKHF